MWKQRIACQTYLKYPKERWPESEFLNDAVKMPHGEVIRMELAERGWFMGNNIWVREIRRKCPGGHQTSILSTDHDSDFAKNAAHMLARWSQENFFKYMMEHFDIDALTGYKLTGCNETKQVVNPKYRQVEGPIKKHAGILGRRKAKFHDLQINESERTPKKMEEYERKKGELREEIENLQMELESFKKERKQTKKHRAFEEFLEEDQFHRIASARKQLLNTVKMIAYRTETAMAQILREHLRRKDDARPLLRQIYNADIDLVPDENNKTLTIKLHGLTNRQADRAVNQLCDHLNKTETIYPGTEFKLKFEMVSN